MQYYAELDQSPCKSFFCSRGMGAVTFGAESAALIINVVSVPFESAFKIFTCTLKPCCSKVTLWDEGLHPWATTKIIRDLVFGSLCTCIFGCTVPKWNLAIHKCLPTFNELNSQSGNRRSARVAPMPNRSNLNAEVHVKITEEQSPPRGSAILIQVAEKNEIKRNSNSMEEKKEFKEFAESPLSSPQRSRSYTSSSSRSRSRSSSYPPSLPTPSMPHYDSRMGVNPMPTIFEEPEDHDLEQLEYLEDFLSRRRRRIQHNYNLYTPARRQ